MAPFRRELARPRLTALGGLAALSALLAAGCGDADHTQVTPAQGGERTRTDALEIDPLAIVGRLEGRQVWVEVPVHALDTRPAAIELSLWRVDNTEVFSSARLEQPLQRGEVTRLGALLELPEEAASQADLVKYNVRVQAEGALSVTRSLQHVVPPHELRLEGPGRVGNGRRSSYRVIAQHPLTRAPLAERDVTLSIAAEGAEPERHVLRTDASGTATLELDARPAGEYTLSASAAAFGTAAAVDERVEVRPSGSRVLLTTDKPIYKPGQTVHLRALSLSGSARTPDAAAPVTLEIDDGRGNTIFNKTLPTDTHGIVSSDFVLGQILNEGTFEVRATAGDTVTEKTIEVFEYALPKFELGVATDRAWYGPGERALLELETRYFFGRPVTDAAVEVELFAEIAGEVALARVLSRTDADGRALAEIELPMALPGLDIGGGNGLAYVRVTATDAAGQTVQAERTLTVAAQPARITLVPEAGPVVVPGVDNRVDLFVTDPLGNPVPEAAGRVLREGREEPFVTDAFGQVKLVWPAAEAALAASGVNVEVDAGGQTVRQHFSFAPQSGREHLLVRTERAVYDVGESVDVEILTTASGPVYVDWLNDGQAVAMRTLTPSDGVARFSLPIDEQLLGESRISAYVVDDGGNVVRTGRTLFARSGRGLQIRLSSDRPIYAPGEPARLTFDVTDESGAPAVAALGVQIVDEAVFSVIDAKPGLLRSYFELEDEFARPTYQIAAPGGDLGELLLDRTAAPEAPARAAAQTRAAANLAALGDAPLTGLSVSSWAATVASSQALLAPYLEAARADLIPALSRSAGAAVSELAASGCRARDYYCDRLGQSFVEAVRERIARGFGGHDFWGTAYGHAPAPGDRDAAHLVSAGPDELPGTSDDLSVRVTFAELGLELAAVDFDANDEAAGAPNAQAPVDFSDPGASAPGAGSAGGPRVRRDFPETLYVNPALITDGSGRATIEVPLADSITEWRVSSLAHSSSGQLGGAASGITVFQDFFVDVSFPATLTRGDEIAIPIAVYNYLDAPQSVAIALEAADWYTPLGETALGLELGAGEVRGLSVPLRVEQVGLQTLTVSAQGQSVADAVARRVRVVPDGQPIATAASGALAPGSTSHTVSFPEGAVPGSEQLYLNVHPSFFSQAVSGMDSVLAVPSGCFEQTTSTTWPNVLVTAYMQATGQITPEIQLHAESLISAGYQRLLTFEHPGGGFSWFGTQDPAPFLSVTAFGLMEFADMKAVHPVDEAMIARTQAWLLAQQAPDGSWAGDQSEFFSFHTSLVRNTAFVLWALAENGYRGPEMARGVAFVRQGLASAAPAERDDAYTLALVANTLVLLADPGAAEVLDRLDALKLVEGDQVSWPTELETSFYGGGRDADVTTTALVTHALLRANAAPTTIEGALQSILSAKDANGNFGSTQATTWSLKTLLLAATRGTEAAVGTLSVQLDGEEFASVPLSADAGHVVTTVDMSALASPGDHDVTLEFAGTGRVGYHLVTRHHVPTTEAPAEPSGPLAIEIGYDRTTFAVDDRVVATARVENRTDAPLNMVLVTLGVPPGFDVDLGAFQPHLDAGTLSRVERTERQLILYVSALAPQQALTLEYGLIATLPVRASDGGAEASLYYEPDQKTQAPAIELVAVAP